MWRYPHRKSGENPAQERYCDKTLSGVSEIPGQVFKSGLFSRWMYITLRTQEVQWSVFLVMPFLSGMAFFITFFHLQSF